MTNKVLMTGAGAPGAAGILKCLKLGGYEVVLADSNKDAYGQYLYNDEFKVIPSAGDDNYVEAILKICKDHTINIILPLVTKELFKL